MNWVGGARNRMRVRDERKQQKEFFEKKRFTSKVAKALATMKSKTGVSQDILSLNTIRKMHAQKPSQEPRVTKVDLDRAKPASRRLDHVELSDVSPIKCVSRIPLLDAKESKKEELKSQQRDTTNKPIQAMLPSQLRSMWGPGPGNRKNDLKTPLGQIMPRRRSAASSIYALTSESVSLKKVEDDTQLTQPNNTLPKPRTAPSECEDETPFIHSFNPHIFPKSTRTTDDDIGNQHYKTPANQSWSSQSTYQSGSQEFAPRNSSLWSGFSFHGQSTKLKSLSPTENLPDNFWKQQKPYPKDFDIFASKRRIKELYQNDEPVRPKIKRRSEKQKEPLCVEPTITENQNDSDALEILDDQAYNKNQPGSMSDVEVAQVKEPTEANIAVGSPDLPVMGSGRVFQGRIDSRGSSENSEVTIEIGQSPTATTIPASKDTVSAMEIKVHTDENEDMPLDLSLKPPKRIDDKMETKSAKDELPQEWDTNGLKGKCHDKKTTVAQYCNWEEPLALLSSSRQSNSQISCNEDRKINEESEAISETTAVEHLRVRDIPVKSDGSTSGTPKVKERGSCDSGIKLCDTGETWSARSNYRPRPERTFSFTKTPLISRRTTDSQDHNGLRKGNDKSHGKSTSSVSPFAMPKGGDEAIARNAINRPNNQTKTPSHKCSRKLIDCKSYHSMGDASTLNEMNTVTTQVRRKSISTAFSSSKPSPNPDLFKPAQNMHIPASTLSQLSSYKLPATTSIDQTVPINYADLDDRNSKERSDSKMSPMVPLLPYPSKARADDKPTPMPSETLIIRPNRDTNYDTEFARPPFSSSQCNKTAKHKPVFTFKAYNKSESQPIAEPLKMHVNSQTQGTRSPTNIDECNRKMKAQTSVSTQKIITKDYLNAPTAAESALKNICSPLTCSSEEKLVLTSPPATDKEEVCNEGNPHNLCINQSEKTPGRLVPGLTGEEWNDTREQQDISDVIVHSLTQPLLDSQTREVTNELENTIKLPPQADPNYHNLACEKIKAVVLQDVALSPFLIQSLMDWPERQDSTEQFTQTEVSRRSDKSTQCEITKPATHQFTQTEQCSKPEPTHVSTVSIAVQCELCTEIRMETSFLEAKDKPANESCLSVDIKPSQSSNETIVRTHDATDTSMYYEKQTSSKEVSQIALLCEDETVQSFDSYQSEICSEATRPSCATAALGVNVTEHKMMDDTTTNCKTFPDNCQAVTDDDVKLQAIVPDTKPTTEDSIGAFDMNAAGDHKKHEETLLKPLKEEENDAMQCEDDKMNHSQMSLTKGSTDPSLCLEVSECVSDTSEEFKDLTANYHQTSQVLDESYEADTEAVNSTQESMYESAEDTPLDKDQEDRSSNNTNTCKFQDSRSIESPTSSRSPRMTRSSTRWKPPVK